MRCTLCGKEKEINYKVWMILWGAHGEDVWSPCCDNCIDRYAYDHAIQRIDGTYDAMPIREYISEKSPRYMMNRADGSSEACIVWSERKV